VIIPPFSVVHSRRNLGDLLPVRLSIVVVVPISWKLYSNSWSAIPNLPFELLRFLSHL